MSSLTIISGLRKSNVFSSERKKPPLPRCRKSSENSSKPSRSSLLTKHCYNWAGIQDFTTIFWYSHHMIFGSVYSMSRYSVFHSSQDYQNIVEHSPTSRLVELSVVIRDSIRIYLFPPKRFLHQQLPLLHPYSN